MEATDHQQNPALKETGNLHSVDLPRYRIQGPARARFVHVPAWRVAYSHRNCIAIYHHTIHLQNRLRSMCFLCKLNIRQTLQINGWLKLQLRDPMWLATAQLWPPSFTAHLGLPWAICDQTDIFDGAVAWADFLQLLFCTRERQPRDEDLLFLNGRVVLKHLQGWQQFLLGWTLGRAYVD